MRCSTMPTFPSAAIVQLSVPVFASPCVTKRACLPTRETDLTRWVMSFFAPEGSAKVITCPGTTVFAGPFRRPRHRQCGSSAPWTRSSQSGLASRTRTRRASRRQPWPPLPRRPRRETRAPRPLRASLVSRLPGEARRPAQALGGVLLLQRDDEPVPVRVVLVPRRRRAARRVDQPGRIRGGEGRDGARVDDAVPLADVVRPVGGER